MGETSLRLTIPSDDASSTRRVLKRFLKKMARDAVALPPELVGQDLFATARATRTLLQRFGRDAPKALYKVLRRPHVHGLLACTYRALGDRDTEAAAKRARSFVFQLLAELALDGALDDEIIWPAAVPGEAVSSPTHRQLVSAPADSVRAVRFEPGAIQLEGLAPRRITASEPPSESFVPVAPGMTLALVDNNPISDFEAHPDKEGNALDLGTAPATRWAGVISEALDLVDRYLPDLRREMSLLLQQFVPVGTDDHSHLSASYRELIGNVYLTLHPHIMTMTEAVIHEYQHNKINALFHTDHVMENAYWPLYESPVRPDPRPLHGILLAAHAFVPVAELYRRMVDGGAPEAQSSGFADRFRQIIAKNDEALGVLEAHARSTPAGDEVIDELGRWHREHLALGV